MQAKWLVALFLFMTEQEYLQKFDELNIVRYELLFSGVDEAKKTFADTLFDAYVEGFVSFGGDANLSYDKAVAAIEKSYEGVSIYDTMAEYVATSNLSEIERLLVSEYHRVFNRAAMDAAKSNGRSKKTWVTVGDDKVRETHDFLDGVTVGIDDEFVTYDGDSAQYPGDFALAQNNANCRCWLMYA